MPGITLGASQSGPVVNIQIGPSIPLQNAMLAGGLTPPPPVTGTFLVDTGASHTVACGLLLAKLNLNPTGTVMCHTPSTGGTAVPMYQYDLMIYMPGQMQHPGWLIDALPVMGSDFSAQPIDGLIGRDIIDRGMLVYNGQAGYFTLCY